MSFNCQLFGTRGDNIAARFGAESELITGTRRSYLHFFAYDFVPAICGTSLVDRYSRIPRNISSDETVSRPLSCRSVGPLGLTMGALQRQGAAQARRRLLRARAPNSLARPLQY